MNRTSAFRGLAILVLAAGILLAASCKLESTSYYINGSIDATAYDKSGYVEAETSGGATFLLAADSIVELAAYDGLWSIDIDGTATGTYEAGAASVAYWVSSSEGYLNFSDVTVVVTEYTGVQVAGTFTGFLNYSVDALDYPVSGEFRVPF
jgi:hypothetical protein